ASRVARRGDGGGLGGVGRGWGTGDSYKQRTAITELEKLGDPRTPDAYLDRLEHDPSGTACADELLVAAGRSRRPAIVDRLLAVFEKEPKLRPKAFGPLLMISGYDQRIEDYEDERPDRRWLEKQHPRHDDILARLMDRCFALGETRFLKQLVPAARWARGKQVDPVLALLVAHSDEELRQQAIESLGWRL